MRYTKAVYLSSMVCGLATVLIAILRTREKGLQTDGLYTYHGDDYPELLPIQIPRNVLLAVEESVHYQLDGVDGRYDWASIEPIGGGYVRLGPNRRIFAIAMGHELHCLHMLRISLAEPGHHLASLGHSKHCLDYLRQWILCNPDLTLEPFDPLARNFSTDRVGATHICRDWNAVYTAAARNMEEWKDFVSNAN